MYSKLLIRKPEQVKQERRVLIELMLSFFYKNLEKIISYYCQSQAI